MNERIKLLRKTLNLSQTEFGKRLGITGGGISKLEKGQRNFTEQMIKSICREFSVSYIWFVNGEGKMFSNSDENIYKRIDKIMFGENEFHKNLLKSCINLEEEDLLNLAKLIDKLKADF